MRSPEDRDIRQNIVFRFDTHSVLYIGVLNVNLTFTKNLYSISVGNMELGKLDSYGG